MTFQNKTTMGVEIEEYRLLPTFNCSQIYIDTASFEFKWAMRLEFIIKPAKYILGMLCIRYLQPRTV